MGKRVILAAAGLGAGGVVWILPVGVIPFAARIVGLAIVGALCFALGATRGRRPDPSVYSRDHDEDREPVYAHVGPPLRALPAAELGDENAGE